MRKYSTTVLIALALMFLPMRLAWGQYVPCTSIASVATSHFVTHNNDYGGHINTHVLGETPPPGYAYSQAGKTLFSSSFDWEQAYVYLSGQVQPLQCNLSAAIGTEAARTLNLQFFSVQCTAANANGMCTNWYTVQTHTVVILMRVVSNGMGGKYWIVYNAYPRPQQ